jgi:hypothetical protein
MMAPQSERAAAIPELWAQRRGDAIAELLIDLEEDRGIALEVATVLKDVVPPAER